jgi:hypothetical protein
MSGALRDDDVIELGEMLEFLVSFLNAERAVVAPALVRFCGGYSLAELRADLARFAFLLGGDGSAFIHGENP